MKKLIKQITGVAVIAATALTVMAGAPNAPSYFGTTNFLSTSNSLIYSWPTNQSGTNVTGGPLPIYYQYDAIEFGFKAYVSNTASTTSIVSVLLTPSAAGNTPTWNTNSTVLYTNAYGFTNTVYGQNDFSSNFVTINIAIPQMVGWYDFETNILLSSTTLPNANYVGIWGITNNIPSPAFVWAPQGPFYIQKKIHTTSLSGN